MSGVTATQAALWRDHGYLAIEGFFSDRDVTAIENALDRTWSERPSGVTVDDLVTGERLRASTVTDDQIDHIFKVNDLYLVDRQVRAVAGSQRVIELVGELLGDTPVMCNTLNLRCGSQQADHLDTLYMTPRTEGRLVATWMALEDVAPDAGPLRYWPGSQRIPLYRFSSGTLHINPGEMDAWAEHMAEGVSHAGLAEERFLARRGDLFIWDALLLHGGSQIDCPGRTRNSLVTHFWSKTDCDALAHVTRPVEDGAGFWLDRAPQPIPGETVTSEQAELAERSAAERLVTAVQPTGERKTLYDRLRSVVRSHR